MRERIKNISNKKIVIITLCVMIVILILGFTYAYWTRTFTQTGINENLYECFEIEFAENVEGISQLQGYPQTDEEGLKTPAYEVTIKNTCNTAASYNVILHKLNTSSLDDSHLKVAVDKDIRLLSETETTETTIENATEARIINTGIIAGKDSKTIKVRSWMEENTSEEEGQNKSFSYKITIEATASKSDLGSIILSSNKLQTAIPDFTLGEVPMNGEINTGSGLYATSDDDGVSYYFRGDINNNYVSFANLTWRIIRINGDRSIRIMSENSYNGYTEADAANYTINNEHECTKDNPCTKDSGTSSDLKTKLESWYESTLKDYDDKIILGSFCNDTTSAAQKRIIEGNPTLNCPIPPNNNGGLYKLKVGLITADEMNFAGLIWWDDDLYDNYFNSYRQNYLLPDMFITFTPTTSGNLIVLNDLCIDNDVGYSAVHPVINLKSNIKVASGDGTKNNPYIIE